MAKRVVYQIDPKRRKPDGSFPDFVFKNCYDKNRQKKWLYRLYLLLAYNASRRKISFAFPFFSFLNFCRETNYHALRGLHSSDLTIDRIDNLKGYAYNNIQALTRSDNLRKYHHHDIKRGKRDMG